MKNLTTGKPIKLILLFAIPLFIGQLFQLFYSLVDTRIVGSTLGDTALAAVGATSTLSDMLNGLLNGFTNGYAIIIATYFGANDEKQMDAANYLYKELRDNNISTILDDREERVGVKFNDADLVGIPIKITI